MKIAIIGSGISGLTAARALHRKHEISVFESNDYIGGHTNTVDVIEQEQGRVIPVDTGFIVFNEKNYPNLCRLFTDLNVASRESDMSFSVQCRQSGLEYNGSNLNKLFSQRKNIIKPGFWFMLNDIMRFNKETPDILNNHLNDLITVDEFAYLHQYGKRFVEHYLIPLGSSLWSCPAEQFRQFPIRFVLEFLDNHCMLQVDNRPQWRTVVGGSREYIKPLTESFKHRIFLNKAVQKVIRQHKKVNVHFQGGTEDTFDEVIMATHADQSLKLIEDPDEQEIDILKMFPYQDNDVVLHTDTALLPANKRAWASWNYLIPEQDTSHASLTYNMNMLQGIVSQHTYCVSLNQSSNIRQDSVIRRIRYHHPIFKPGRDAAQASHPAMIQRRGISYCGAYWGFGFHEDGVSSALNVSAAFNQELAA